MPHVVVFRESIYMGDTDLTQAEVLQLVQKMGTDFKGNRYHLLQRNCNHFATELCNSLVGKPAPYWVREALLRRLSLNPLIHRHWPPDRACGERETFSMLCLHHSFPIPSPNPFADQPHCSRRGVAALPAASIVGASIADALRCPWR